MALPSHTSASQLSTYAACPKKYALRYLERAEREHTGVGLILGGVVHSALEFWFERKKTAPPTLDELEDVANADFDAALDGPPVAWGRWSPKDFREHTMKVVRFAVETLGDMPVRRSEAKFTLPLVDPKTGRELPRPLVGYLDFVLDDDSVVELKTARAAYNDTNVRTSLQFAAYLTALSHLGLGDVLRLEVLVKTKMPKAQRVLLTPTPEVERWFFETAGAIESAIAAGHFPPAPGFTCGFCEYQRQCLGAAPVSYAEAA